MVRRRALLKGRITKNLKHFESLHDEEKDTTSIEELINSLTSDFDSIIQLDQEVVCLSTAEQLDEEIEKSSDYDAFIRWEITKLKRKLSELVLIASTDTQSTNKDCVNLPLPLIKIDTFSNNTSDPFAFFNFRKTFLNAIAGMPGLSDAQKFIYLKNYLRGEALNLVEGIEISNQGYFDAVKLLEFHFCNKDELINRVFDKLVKLEEVNGLKDVEPFVRKLNNILYDLKGFGINYEESGEFGMCLLSKLINSKLPRNFLIELARITNSQFPKFDQLLKHFSSIIARLSMGQNEGNSVRTKFSPSSGVKTKVSLNNSSSVEPNKEKIHLPYKSEKNNYDKDNFQTSVRCKFCSSQDHKSNQCSVFTNVKSRKEQAIKLGLCSKCLSQKHKDRDCPGNRAALTAKCYTCGKFEHHGAVCPNLVFGDPAKKVLSMSSGTDSLLPVVSLTVSRGKNCSSEFVFLLDTGAQISIINKELVEKKVDLCRSPLINKMVTSFGNVNKCQAGYNYVAYLTLPCGSRVYSNFFAIEGFSLPVQIPMLDNIKHNVRSAGYKLSPNFDFGNENITVHGIIGNDLLRDFRTFSIEPISLKGSNNPKLLRLHNGYVPYGSTDSLLNPQERLLLISRQENIPTVKDVSVPNEEVINTQIYTNSALSKGKLEDLQVVRRDIEYSPPKKLNLHQTKAVNFILNPIKENFDPLEDFFDGSHVEHGLDRLYKLESIGINEDDGEGYSEAQIIKFKESISFKDGHYYVELPWIEDKIKQVPSNCKIALAVAEKVYDRLEKKGILNEYENVFQQQEELGIIEPVLEKEKGQIWVPHRPVIKDSELTTTKIRPVFNCSLKVGKLPSLNEAAFPGVDLMNNLLSLLLYLRTNDYAVLADIAKAFLQIRLSSAVDKNRFCFFRKRGDSFIPYRYNTILFGFISSPFILNYIVQYHLALNSEVEVSTLIKEKFYVDNLVYTSSESSFLPQFVSSVNSLMKEGGLPLREWTSNNPQALEPLSEEETCDKDSVKVLGYLYEVGEDNLSLNFKDLNTEASTKRQILSSYSTNFDPLGLFAPVLLKGKLLIRRLCQLGVEWDQMVPGDILEDWRTFCNQMDDIRELRFSRRTFVAGSPVKLFLFSDASKEAYGCSLYVVQGELRNLVFAKVKVSPLRERTLPTLELLAAMLALKCLSTFMDGGLFNEVIVEQINLLIDSQVVLSWILSNKAPRKNRFVNNRLSEISGLMESIKMRSAPVSLVYIPSLHNQADFLTKCCSARSFKDKFEQWLSGPEWMTGPVDSWPKGGLGCIPHKAIGDLISPILNPNPVPKALEVVDVSKYSSFTKLIRIMTNVYKFLFRIRKLDLDPVEAAMTYLMKKVQGEAFPEELEYLKSDNVSSLAVPKLVINLNLFLDDKGLIRSKGRIEKNIELKYQVVNPVLLPKSHHFTLLVIKHAHCESLHMGLQSTLNFLRSHGIWIVKAGQAVRSFLNTCIVCKRFNARGIKYPSPASLPAHRVNLSTPFKHTGVDYTGHLWLKNEQGEHYKIYILIFTCFNTRAIHLEVVESMTTSEFLLAFIRFVNLYGVPDSIYSDNARSFLQAGGVLSEILASSEFEEKFKLASIKHRTIPAYAAWYGAVWERLLRTVKQCLYKSLGRYTPTYMEFITLLSDVQRVINNRPLTYRSCDNEMEVITPNHFIRGGIIPSIMFKELAVEPEWELDEQERLSVLDNTLALRDSLATRFKDKWLKEYLLSLREKDRASQFKHKLWSVGDVALLKLPHKSTVLWPFVRIIQIFADAEGVIRTVRISKADKKEMVVNVSHLISLELHAELTNPEVLSESLSDRESDADSLEFQNDDTESDSEIDDHDTTRPLRTTAKASRLQTQRLAREGYI